MFDIFLHSRLCPLASASTKVTQACLNQTLLAEPGSGTTRFFIETIAHAGTGVYTISLQLPSQITCDNCVLQWFYNTGKLIYLHIILTSYFSSPCLTYSNKAIIISTVLQRILLWSNYIIQNYEPCHISELYMRICLLYL